jgi:thiol-disulfide isomerase/thioredoxin
MNKKIILLITLGLAVFIAAALYVDRHPSNIAANTPRESATASPQTSSTSNSVNLKNYGPAPEFKGITKWLNSDPLTIAGLRGKTVLIDFWTYSCINCIRTLPHVTGWYDTYRNDGLVVVGVHTPEFAFEKETSNVQDAIKRFGIHYPVAQDNDYGTWNAYNNQYWPAEYLIDKNGDIIDAHFGEGNYDETENIIRTLLGLGMAKATPANDNLSQVQSPEMYFGTNRLQYLTPSQSPSANAAKYIFPTNLALNNFAFNGNWQFGPESVKLVSGQGSIRLKFHAGKVHIVASSPSPAKLTISVDGKSQPVITVKNSELYTLFDSSDYSDHIIEIIIDQSGFEAFTFTFG